jgi:tetratricopeptide (TPR) repeat protein
VWVILLQTVLAGFGAAQRASDSISGQSDDVRGLKMPAPPFSAATNGASLSPGATLSLEDWRALLHLYARLGRPRMVEIVAARIFRSHPRDRETLRLLTSFYLERKDASRALKYARAQATFYPDEEEAGYLLAMAYQLDGQIRLAHEVLAEMKAKNYSDGFFPYEAELASVALLTGDWPQAIRSYREMLEDPSLRPEERREARIQLEELYRTHGPRLLLKESFTHFQSGLIFRSVAQWSQPLASHHRLHLGLERDDFKLNRADLLRPHWTDRYDVLAGVESDFLQWRTKVFGGIGDEGGIYGADLTRVLGPDEDLTLAWHGNQRATDSLLLETLHGREDALSVFWRARFYPDVLANLKLQGRRVLVAGETLGHGYSVDLSLERMVLQRLPELHLGYHGLISGYSPSSENIRLVADVAARGTSDVDRRRLLDDLVSPINLHGLFLSWQQTINPSWRWNALAGSDYSFTRSTFGYTFETGLSCFPSPNTEVVSSVGYSTSASTSDEDSKRWELSLALRFNF